MSDVVIRAENLGKRYRLGQREKYKSLRAGLSNPFRRQSPAEMIWALRDVSFEIKQGEVVGIIGRNGAGKSTLLKILSRITEPTTGYADITGRIGSLLEVGTGFHPELTGRENIFLNGAILGMKRAEIAGKFDEIVAFAEVEKFVDTPVKHYSSGMYVRLAFAVAAHLEPETSLVDEVLAVGDAAFQKKCLGKMGSVAKEGRTVLFVSHSMAAIRELCAVCFWIDDGRIRQTGFPAHLIDDYLRATDQSRGAARFSLAEDLEKEFQLRSGQLCTEEGEVTQTFDCDGAVVIDLSCQVHRSVPGLYGYLSISKMDGTPVLVSDSFDVPPNPLDELPIGKHSLQVRIPPRSLGPGDYAVYMNFTSAVSARDWNVDSPGTILTFRLDDHTSRRGNQRLGHFSTLLPWSINSPPLEESVS